MLTAQGERQRSEDGHEIRELFFRQMTVPRSVDGKNIQCFRDDKGNLTIRAPMAEDVEMEQAKKDYIEHQKEYKPLENVLLFPPPITALKTETGEVLKVAPKPTVTMSSYAPKVRNFSGGENKGKIAYDIWRYDVKIAFKDPTYTKTQKDCAIRRSLSRSAAQILDSVYGSVDNKEQLLSEVYSARQKEDEDVTTWNNRLQDILGKGIEKGIIPYHEMNTMLHAMLWTELRQELKDVSGHKYDSIQDFNHLRVALRQIEKDHQPKKNHQA
ncbi:FAB1 [Mytilus edulis]|uniref:PIKFYVE n=1 Tax=Mytilus edulis TaxID=6550 RepID=A0A8S3PZH4_MYTED|nr:FAB1 [Mytilus edulis]